MTQSTIFLSTPSARRATLRWYARPPALSISIHALREEGDGGCIIKIFLGIISIHALREEGDSRAVGMCIGIVISIHALREEGDPPLTPALAMVANFYPRPPRGGRPRRAGYRGQHFAISIHALREEGDGMPLGVEPSQQISIHALREEGDPGRCGQIGETHISIHALREEGDPGG